jgi:predicted PurR-regulated permease PerM
VVGERGTLIPDPRSLIPSVFPHGTDLGRRRAVAGRARPLSDHAALWILAAIATLFFLRTAKSLVIPIALAVLVTYALAPMVRWLERHHVPRLAGVPLVMLLVMGVVAAGAYALRDDVQQVVEALPRAAEQAQEIVSSQTGLKAGNEAVGTSGEMPGSLLERGAGAIFSAAGHAVVIFFLTFFLLLSGHLVRDRIVETAGADADGRRTVSTIIDEINAQIQRYLLVLLVSALIVGIATWIVLAWLGVEHALMWGVLAGIFNSIPYFGPAIVSGGLFAVGLVQGGGVAQAVQMAGAAIVITSLEGWLLTPPLMGKAERMNAVAVFLGLLVWTWVWGGWGTILAVPMLVIVKSVADHVERFKPVGRLMAP